MNKNIVIIGATSDIAESVAQNWAEKKHNFFLVARNEERLESICSDLNIQGAQSVESALLDVRNEERYPEIIHQITSHFDSIDILLIAHGSLSNRDKCEQNIQKAAEEFQINATSVIALCLGFAEQMKDQGKGTIAVISSVAGDRGRQSNYVYGAGKGALNTFLQGLRNRLYHVGVHVLTIKPGPVDTKMTDEKDKNFLWSTPSAVAKKIISAIDNKRDVIYVPGYWRIIMFVVRAIPESIFKRLKL